MDEYTIISHTWNLKCLQMVLNRLGLWVRFVLFSAKPVCLIAGCIVFLVEFNDAGIG